MLPKGAGDRHAYLGGSASCWVLYGEVLQREFSDPAYMAVHRKTVDAYAAQHPGLPEPRTIQSVNVHLVGLHLVFDLGLKPEYVRRMLSVLAKRKGALQWLTPPETLGEITVADVAKAENPQQHAEIVDAWGRAVWRAWTPHHPLIRDLAQSAMAST